MLADGGEEVLGVLPPHVLHAKIVDYQAEGDGAGDVLEEAGRVGHLEVSGGGQPLLEQLVGEGSRLRKSVDGTADLRVNEAALRVPPEVVLLDRVLGEDLERDPHVLVVFGSERRM